MYCTFIDYVADIYNTLMTAPRAELKALENELKQEVPAPLHSMLEKEKQRRCHPQASGQERDGHLSSNMHRYLSSEINVHKKNYGLCPGP